MKLPESVIHKMEVSAGVYSPVHSSGTQVRKHRKERVIHWRGRKVID